jgi:hypothetical protein
MDVKEPKTRTENKKGGKGKGKDKDKGTIYSSKHVRIAAALASKKLLGGPDS